MSVNKAMIIGRLGRDPEMKTFDSGSRTTFSVATDRAWTDKATGVAKKETDWHRVVAWDKTAENAHRYLSKGRQVYVEGRIQTNKWQDKDGKDRSTTEIIAHSIQFLGDAKHEDQEAPAPVIQENSLPF